jgi:hypothetical protein
MEISKSDCSAGENVVALLEVDKAHDWTYQCCSKLLRTIAEILHGAARLAAVPTEAFSSSAPSSVKQSLFSASPPGESIQ